MKIFFLTLLLFLTSCLPRGGIRTFTVTTYNVSAFFDAYEGGTEFDGYSHSDGYDGERYDERVREMAILIGRNLASSDLIILQEVESRAVLSDLLEKGLSLKGFSYYGIAEEDGNLAVGFISKIKPSDVSIHKMPGHRAILELSFYLDGDPITVYGLHFRSRLDGGAEERVEETRYLSTLLSGNESLAVASGDFNLDPEGEGEAIGLFPDGYPDSHALYVSGNPDKAGRNIYFAPSLDEELVFSEEGTHEYQGEWYFYDMHLLSEECWDGMGWEYESAWITAEPIMKDELGRPYDYDPSNGRGYSDHFPFTVRLVKKHDSY